MGGFSGVQSQRGSKFKKELGGTNTKGSGEFEGLYGGNGSPMCVGNMDLGRKWEAGCKKKHSYTKNGLLDPKENGWGASAVVLCCRLWVGVGCFAMVRKN